MKISYSVVLVLNQFWKCDESFVKIKVTIFGKKKYISLFLDRSSLSQNTKCQNFTY